MKIYEIPGKLTVEWNDEVKAIIDTWSSYFTTLEEFKDAVLRVLIMQKQMDVLHGL